MQQVAVRWQSKTSRGNVSCRAGSTIGLLSLAVRAYEQSVLSVCLYLVCGANACG